MKRQRGLPCKVAVGMIVFLAFAPVSMSDEPDATDLAKAAQNPLASMISLPFQNNTNTNFGPQEKTQNILNIQPVWPIEWNDNWNFITRTIIPVMSQPALSAAGSRENGLGDISFTGFFSPKASGKWIWGVGPAALLPTGSDALTADKWGLGPSAVVLTFNGPWVYGGLINNIWSVSGSGAADINLMTLQPFLNYNLPGGRYFTSAPVINANWEADSGEQWTVPLGLGYGKIFKLGNAPVNGQISLYHNIEKPTNGADWQLRLQLQFMFPK
ncbi:MAG: hypothetical protein QGH58_04740 [Arenicellales bacterium]|nr:hypothetical protein [Arenicellales bacterium]MDP6552655.1 hypothetical protein [Arenicellales bacterium]MDP6791201.1 hypothetical protein [Arenicellales bacterium]MDP6917818.1 hypothetical protein [Arenicellales bacterium]